MEVDLGARRERRVSRRVVRMKGLGVECVGSRGWMVMVMVRIMVRICSLLGAGVALGEWDFGVRSMGWETVGYIARPAWRESK